MSSSSHFHGGPLTTIFTPPAGCFEPLPTEWNSALCWQYFGVICYWSLPASCYPTGASVALSTLKNGIVIPLEYYYSPGVLPSGYTRGNRQQLANGGIEEEGCFSGWHIGDRGTNPFCVQAIVASSESGSESYKTFPYTQTGSSVTVVVVPILNIKWHPTDLTNFRTTSASVPATSTSARPGRTTASQQMSKTSTNQPGSQSPSPQPSSQSSGLSTGGKAGIGVGLTVAPLVLLIIGFIALRRRNRNRASQARSPQRAESPPPPYVESKPELPGREATAELADRGRQELDASYAPQEIADGRYPQELAVESAAQEVEVSREPPPIPFASKPRLNRSRTGMHELE